MTACDHHPVEPHCREGSVECWRPVAGVEDGYEVSDFGRVRSMDQVQVRTGRSGPYTYQFRGRTLRPKNRRGYHVVDVAVRGTRLVHVLVLEAFVGLCPEGMECRHLDGNGLNNRLSNLRWGTRIENAYDKSRLGSVYQLAKTHCPYGHPYRHPNLVTSSTAAGRRMCKACHRARGRAARSIRAGQQVDHQQLSDICLAQIMRGAA